MQEGDCVAGRFVLERLAGEGGMARVYRAFDRDSGAIVALKAFSEGGGVERALREIEVLAALEHTAIVRHLASGTSAEGELFMVMEWLEGETLDQRVSRGPLTVDEVLAIGEQLAGALGAAHAAGVVHRDVKPCNVLLLAGDELRVKLVDFGIARVSEGAQLTSAGLILGTPDYMAPEQARCEAIDARADLFALGVSLFEALAGARPFVADHPLAVMAKILFEPTPPVVSPCEPVPAELARLIAALLAKQPDDRPASAQAVEQALSALRGRRASGRAPLRHVEIEAPESFAPASLGRREVGLTSVLLVAALAGGPVSAATGAASAPLERLRAVTEPYDAHLEQLFDGSAVVLLRGAEGARGGAAGAARCALDLRAALPRHPVVLVTGPSERGDRLPAGLLDRGAALLARRAKGGELPVGIAVDELTARLLERDFLIRGGAPGLALVAERAEPVAARVTRELVGRDAELGALAAWVAETQASGAARARAVVGAAGLGKSTVARALHERLRAERGAAPVLFARADPSRTRVPFNLLARALEHWFGLEDADGAAEAERRVLARVSLHVAPAEVRRVASFLGELVGVPFAGDAHPLLASARADAVRMGDQLRAAWHDWADAARAQVGLALVIDDLELADSASVELLAATLRQPARGPLAIVAFVSSEAGATTWPEVARSQLAPLDPRAARALVESALGERASPQAVARIVDQAEGSPLALEELALAEQEGRSQRTPPTLLALAQARLAALADEERRALRAASVFGDGFHAAGVAALLADADAAHVAGRLEELARRGLLLRQPGAAGSPAYSFCSALLREAAYAMLTDEDRELGHQLVGRLLAEQAGARDAAIVAYHFDAAGDARNAAIWYARAAERALEANDFEATVELAGRGALAGASANLLGRVRLLETEAFRHAGRNQEMLRAGLSALEHLPARSPPWWTAYADAVLGAIRLGEEHTLARLARLATAGSLHDLPAAAARAAHYLQFAGQREPADALLAAVSERLGAFAEDPARWGWAYRAHATRALLDGDVGRYLAQLELAVRAFAASGDVRELTLERANVGFARVELGLYVEAEGELREAIAGAERLGLAHTVAVGLQNLGSAVARQGRLREGSALLVDALARFVAQRNTRMAGNTRTVLSRVCLLRGELTEALALGQQAVVDLELVPPLLPGAISAVARALLAQGEVAAAVVEARRAEAKLLAVGKVDEGEAHVRLTLAEALDAAGEREEARRAIGVARDRLKLRAARLPEPAWRASFLERVADHRRTLELARAWLGDAE